MSVDISSPNGIDRGSLSATPRSGQNKRSTRALVRRLAILEENESVPRRTIAFKIGENCAFFGSGAVGVFLAGWGILSATNLQSSEFFLVALLLLGLGIGGPYSAHRFRRGEWEKKRVLKLKNQGAFVKAAMKIHSRSPEVMVISKTPGLLLPTERDKTDERKEYFRYVNARLASGNANYHLKYLFDFDGFKMILAGYIAKKDDYKIEETRQMLAEALGHENLELKFDKHHRIGKMASAVIGQNDQVCLGLRDSENNPILSGIEIRDPDIVRVVKNQYDLLFNDAPTVGLHFFDEVYDELRSA